MTIRQFNKEQDYEMAAKWWAAHGWTPVDVRILPLLGIVVEDAGIPICASWLYMDNSVGVAMLEWIVTNPEIGPLKASRGIRAMIAFLEEEAHQLGYDVILTTCRQDSLGKFLVKGGFIETDSNVKHFIKIR